MAAASTVKRTVVSSKSRQDDVVSRRCPWAGTDPLYVRYHDEEWGVPVRDDRQLFEMLTLEGAQAGLAWITILRKRDGYRHAFKQFDAREVARFTPAKIEELMGDVSIVRNRLKIESTVSNARALLELQREQPLSDFVWSFVGDRPLRRRPKTMADVPASSKESDALSKALKKRGFRFVGTTICYAFMQACGLVDDHLASCARAKQNDG
jgi:DNA-3-methyladenine glycosylase I